MTEPHHLNQSQEQAVEALERVLARCRRVGVAICGMDDTITAYRADDFDRLADELPSAYEVQKALIDAHTSRPIEDHGAFRESGGW